LLPRSQGRYPRNSIFQGGQRGGGPGLSYFDLHWLYACIPCSDPLASLLGHVRLCFRVRVRVRMVWKGLALHKHAESPLIYIAAACSWD